MRKKETDKLLETNKTPLKKYLGKYWHLYLMMLVPVIYFVIFKYAPMFGNILAFRRYLGREHPRGRRHLVPVLQAL